MTIVRVKGFKIFIDRHGKLRCYHRSSGTPIDLLKHPEGSAEFLAEVARIGAAQLTGKTKAGTLGKLIEEYKAHPAFLDLAPKTRGDYQRYFDYLRPIADTALARFDRKLVVRIRDKAAAAGRRRSANYLRQVLSIVFTWGVERGYLNDNPASNIKSIKRSKDAPVANRPWSDDERHTVLDAVPDHMRPAIALMMFGALGPKDALALPRTAFRDGLLTYRRSKTGEPIVLPAATQLTEILERAVMASVDRASNRSGKPWALTLCTNSTGRPWTTSGFNTAWQRQRARLEAEDRVGPNLTLYGLRHTVAVILRESGLDDRAVADVLGHKGTSMASIYTRGADLQARTRGTAQIFDLEVNRRLEANRRRTKPVKPTA